MRLFIALSLPDEVRAELEVAQRRLQRGNAHPVRWVAPAAIHLTLQFLGEVADARVPDILAVLQGVHATTASQSSAGLSLASVGAFPNLRRPQTIWMGVADEAAVLTYLQRVVSTALEPLGFPGDTRPFHPHLTLGRVRRDATPAQRTALGAALAALPPPRRVTWPCGRPLLFQSTLTPKGSLYEKLGPA